MACQGFDLLPISVDECADNFGGVERVWVADREEWTKASSTVTDGVITLDGAIAADKFVELKFDKNLTNYTETGNFTEGVGLTYTTECAMQFYKMDSSKRNAIDHLAHNKQMIALVLDNNGVTHFMGYNWGVKPSNVSGTTSGSLTEVNSYQVTLQDTTRLLNYVVAPTDAVLTALIAQ